MTATENLWPEFSLDEVIRSPKTILKEQAEFLTKGTKNLLTANITTYTTADGKIAHSFDIIAPNLNGYKYNLVIVVQKEIFHYPCRFAGEPTFSIMSELQLIERLKKIFNDADTKRVISSLIAQSKEDISSQ